MPAESAQFGSRHLRVDLVIIGAGIAGLTAALCAHNNGLSVAVINKGRPWEPNPPAMSSHEPSTATYFAQGGISVVEPTNRDDSIALHTSDTLTAGAGLSLAEPTESIVAEGFSAITQLISWGVEFDKDTDGNFLRTREGGHSVNRIIHSGGDATGARVQTGLGAAVTALASSSNPITVIDNAIVEQIITNDDVAVGITLLGTHGEDLGRVYAPTILLATGGAGHLFATTTNPLGATADGIALALRAGAEVADFEFIQFHPTMLYTPTNSGRCALISEAVRGEGAKLVDVNGNSVTNGVHPLGDLAPRDVVSRAVFDAMARTGAHHVFLDARSIPHFASRFPTVTAGVAARGINPQTELIPVAPGAHYSCGGVVTDATGATKLSGLYAAGEVARTGLHGANRLASNSLLEGLVMGRRVATAANERKHLSVIEAPARIVAIRPAADRGTLQKLMSDRCGVVRNHENLNYLAQQLNSPNIVQPRAISSHTDLEDASLTLAAQILTAAAMVREETRGAHTRSDFSDCSATALSRIITLDPLTGVNLAHDSPQL